MSGVDETWLLKVAKEVTGQTLAAHPWMVMWRDDVLSDAMLGATTAYLSHDANRSDALQSRVYRRARGAVLDGIRDRSPVSRSEWAKGVRQENLPAARGPQLSIEALRDLGLDPTFVDATDDTCANRDDLRRLLADCTDRERVILLATYGYGYTLMEVADWYGVSEALISKLRTACLDRLRQVEVVS